MTDRTCRNRQGIEDRVTLIARPALRRYFVGGRVSGRILAFNRFYGHPARTIADWCGVSLSTARDYKSGKRRPPLSVLRLWSLYADQRALGSEWEHWRIQGNTLIDPDGNITTCHQLSAYWVVMQLAAEQARLLGPEAQERFYEVLHYIKRA